MHRKQSALWEMIRAHHDVVLFSFICLTISIDTAAVPPNTQLVVQTLNVSGLWPFPVFCLSQKSVALSSSVFLRAMLPLLNCT